MDALLAKVDKHNFGLFATKWRFQGRYQQRSLAEGGLADARQQAGLGQATHQSEFVALQLNSLLESRPPYPISLIILPTMTSSLA